VAADPVGCGIDNLGLPLLTLWVRVAWIVMDSEAMLSTIDLDESVLDR
jgi:hypothetical protein